MDRSLLSSIRDERNEFLSKWKAEMEFEPGISDDEVISTVNSILLQTQISSRVKKDSAMTDVTQDFTTAHGVLDDRPIQGQRMEIAFPMPLILRDFKNLGSPLPESLLSDIPSKCTNIDGNNIYSAAAGPKESDPSRLIKSAFISFSVNGKAAAYHFHLNDELANEKDFFDYLLFMQNHKKDFRLVFYIHSFKSKFQQGKEDAIKLNNLLLHNLPLSYVKVIPIFWPCADFLYDSASYYDDRSTIRSCAGAMMELFENISRRLTSTTTFLMAHATGCYFVQQAIKHCSRILNPPPFAQVILVAADTGTTLTWLLTNGLTYKIAVLYNSKDDELGKFESAYYQKTKLGICGPDQNIRHYRDINELIGIDCTNDAAQYSQVHRYHLEEGVVKNHLVPLLK